MPNKRGNNEGSLTKRSDGRWQACITLDGGKRKFLYAKTRQEAARLLTNALRDRDQGLPIVGEKRTVAQYLMQWLQDIAPGLKPRIAAAGRADAGRSRLAGGRPGLHQSNALGGPLRANHVLQRQFTPLLKQAGLPLIRFHDLRHTAATLMLRQGIHPKIVAGMLGHSTVSMTLDIYSHVIPDMQRGATEALDRLLGNAESAEAIAPADGRPAGITGKMTRPREGAKRGQNARRERKATMEGDNGDRGHTARSDCADRGLMSELMSKSLQ